MFDYSIIVPLCQDYAIRYTIKKVDQSTWKFFGTSYPIRESEKVVVIVKLGKLPGQRPVDVMTDGMRKVLSKILIEAVERGDTETGEYGSEPWFRCAIQELHSRRYIDCPENVALSRELYRLARDHESRIRQQKHYRIHESQVSTSSSGSDR